MPMKKSFQVEGHKDAMPRCQGSPDSSSNLLTAVWDLYRAFGIPKLIAFLDPLQAGKCRPNASCLPLG